MRLSYSVELVAAGILLALLPIDVGIPLSPDGVFTMLLPLLISKPHSDRWPPFRRELPVILLLAFTGVVTAAPGLDLDDQQREMAGHAVDAPLCP
jgi:Na+:H+ antiporter